MAADESPRRLYVDVASLWRPMDQVSLSTSRAASSMSSDDDNDQDRSTRAADSKATAARPLLSRGAGVQRGPSTSGVDTYRPLELPSDLRERAQLLREFETRAGAYHTAKTTWVKAQHDGDPDRVKSTRRLAHHLTSPLANYIEAVAQKSMHKSGPRERWLAAYKVIGADALAHHTISGILSVLITSLASGARHKPIHATAVSREIGQRIAIAARLAAWQKLNPPLFAAFERRLKEAGATPLHRAEVLAIGLNKKARDPLTASAEFLEATASWPARESARIGRWLLFVAEHVTGGAITLHRQREGRKGITAAPYHVELSPSSIQRLADAVEVSALRATNDRAMVCPPRAWNGSRNGGYLLGDDLRFDRTYLVLGHPPARKSIEEALADDQALAAAAPVFTAINSLQDTPFAINEAVHDTAAESARAGHKLNDLPASYRWESVPKPPKTGDSEADKARHLQWRRAEAAVKNRNARNVPKALWSHAVLAEAQELRELEIAQEPNANGPLWFAHRVDFRGRMYPEGSALNPQGSDLARSLLRFHRGKPIGNGRGPFWLAAQVAKAFGRDKLSWDDRVAWTHTNEDMITRIANDPLGNRRLWKKESDKLWAALAAAREWTDYRATGSTFVTTLPIFIDGTCNGLQHYAALSGDTDLARLVNLEPEELPQDIYREVAEEAFRDIKVRSERGRPIDRRMAHLWLRLIGNEVPRSMVKKVVMTKPYGGTNKVALDAAWAFLAEKDPERLEWGGEVPDSDVPALIGWLANRMQSALKDRTSAADKIMAWLQESMRFLSNHGVADRLDFRTPAGFPMRNLYFGHKSRTVKVTVEGKRRSMTIAENDPSKFDATRACKSIAPNFVHSLDAAAMMLAIGEANARGVTDLMAIHDCVGGLAPDMDIIAESVRVGFVRTHEAMPLERFREAVLLALPDDEARDKLSELPKRGEFDVMQVLGSRYFFS